MAFPSRTLRAVCEISSGTLKISQRPPAYTHEAGALDVIVDLKNGGNAYVPDASVVAGMYLFWQDTQYMSEFVEMGISGCTLSGTFSDALTAMPGCPLLVVQLQDTDTGDIIVAAAAPIQITKVEGNLIVTTRPPSPSEIVYIGRSPYINTENYHWMQWNSVALAYEDTGVVAKGMPATFTATAQGLPAGSAPTATITGTAENPVINLGIPKGDTGETGATGPAAGFGTISATVDNTSGTPGVTVNTSGPDTAKNMTFAFTGLKGPQGEPGPVSQVCGVSPNAQGNIPLNGTNIPLQTMSLVTVKQAIDNVGATFTGATSSTAGTKGQVPAPAAGEEGHALGGSGNWVTGSGIATSDTVATPIATSLSNLNDQIVNVQNGLATPSVTGSTNNTGSTITKGTYFRLNDVLCFALADIADEATFTVNTNYRVVSEGGLNALGNVKKFDSFITATENATISNVRASKCGRIALISFFISVTAVPSSGWTYILNIPDEIVPYAEYYGIAINDNNYNAVEIKVNSNGVSIWNPEINKRYLSSITYITNI